MLTYKADYSQCGELIFSFLKDCFKSFYLVVSFRYEILSICFTKKYDINFLVFQWGSEKARKPKKEEETDKKPLLEQKIVIVEFGKSQPIVSFHN